MADIPHRVRDLIDFYIRKLEENHIPVQQAILFGSYAAGTFSEGSDIDLAIVSEAFQGSRMSDRAMVRRITLQISNDLEVIPFRPEDFVLDDPFVREIVEKGRRVA
jgi:uncharacterized protein